MPRKTIRWLEEYKNCSCSNVTKQKKDALGYCPIHGNGRQYIVKFDNLQLDEGFVRG